VSDKSKGKRRKRSSGPRVEPGSAHARKVTMLILEVLGGHRTPSDAARALNVSVTRYYMLEKQGLEAMVLACEPKNRGPRRSPDKEIERLQKKVDRLEKECARRQSLIRLSQRALGVRKAQTPKRTPGKRKPKKATVRALKVARQLDATAESSEDN